jgi:hypothetical protein
LFLFAISVCVVFIKGCFNFKSQKAETLHGPVLFLPLRLPHTASDWLSLACLRYSALSHSGLAAPSHCLRSALSLASDVGSLAPASRLPLTASDRLSHSSLAAPSLLRCRLSRTPASRLSRTRYHTYIYTAPPSLTRHPPLKMGCTPILHSANIQTFFTKKRFREFFQLFFFARRGFSRYWGCSPRKRLTNIQK